MAAEPFTIEWYRPRLMGQLVRVCAPCSMLVLLGALSLGFGTRHGGEALEVVSLLLGLTLVIAGPSLAALGLQRVLADDVVLALRSDGITWRCGGRETFLAWDALEGAEVAAESAALTLREAGTERVVLIHARFIGIGTEALVRRIRHLRLRILLDLERPPRRA